MNLYLIQRDSQNVGWDEYASFVIAAHSSAKAREIASKLGGSEFLRSKQSVCELIGEAHSSISEGIILSDFQAG